MNSTKEHLNSTKEHLNRLFNNFERMGYSENQIVEALYDYYTKNNPIFITNEI